MQKNAETIEQLKSEVKNAIAHDPLVRDIEKFNLKNIVIDGSMSIGNKQFSDAAIKKVLNLLNVKPGFVDYRKSMSEKDWDMVNDRIKKAKGDIELYGEITDQEMINAIYLVNTKKKRDDDMTNSLAVIAVIEDELRDSECDYRLSSFEFNKNTYKFSIEFMNESMPIDILNGDIWNVGHRFEFNSVSFKYMPIFERLICKNGMYSKPFGFGSYINKQSFNNEKIEKVINNAIHSFNEIHAKLLEEQAEALKKTNISIAEFMYYKKWFDKGSRKNSNNQLIEKYFNEEPFYKAYGLPVAEQTSVWKKTADSGINAYDFLNMLTWIASHPDQSSIKPEDAIDLKIASSAFFMNQKFDMKQLAPRKNVDYPKLPEMN